MSNRKRIIKKLHSINQVLVVDIAKSKESSSSSDNSSSDSNKSNDSSNSDSSSSCSFKFIRFKGNFIKSLRKLQPEYYYIFNK